MQELRVNASMYDAQQGATSGAQIDVNTATGTNRWHGQVYGSFANNAINASPFFFNQAYQLSQQGVGVFPRSMVNPYLNRWSTGFTAGGPLVKDKLFFFAAYQHRSDSDQATGLSQMTVPSALTDDRSTAGLLQADATWGGSSHRKRYQPDCRCFVDMPNFPTASTSYPRHRQTLPISTAWPT